MVFLKSPRTALSFSFKLCSCYSLVWVSPLQFCICPYLLLLSWYHSPTCIELEAAHVTPYFCWGGGGVRLYEAIVTSSRVLRGLVLFKSVCSFLEGWFLWLTVHDLLESLSFSKDVSAINVSCDKSAFPCSFSSLLHRLCILYFSSSIFWCCSRGHFGTYKTFA